MRLLHLFVMLWAAILCAHEASGQYYFYDDDYLEPEWLWEAGGAVGAMQALTDLGGKKGAGKRFVKDINGRHYNFAGGFYAGVLYHHLIGGRLELTLGKVSGSDNVLNGDVGAAEGRLIRNLSFMSKITEGALLAEFHPLALFDAHGKEPSYFSPYLVGGVGLFHFNPQAFDGYQWVDLQPLRTEGQGFAAFPDRQPYRLTQVNFPLGIGVKYEVSAFVNARLEVLHRVLRTDYLDDVSTTYIDPARFAENLRPKQAAQAILLADRRQELDPGIVTKEGTVRGDPKNNDSYFTIQFKLSMSIGRTRRVKW